MTVEQFDFLREFKKQAIKILIGYAFVSVSLLIGFYIDTKIRLKILEDQQTELQVLQTQQGQSINNLYQYCYKQK